MREGFKEMPPREGVSEQDIDRYIAEHRNEPAWEDIDEARGWGLKNILSYFENECHTLKDKPDLRHVRVLTSFLDDTTRTTAQTHDKPEKLIRDLEHARDEQFRRISGSNPAREQQEKEVAEGNREGWNEDINEFKHGNVGNVLTRIEKITADLNGRIIDHEGYLKNQNNEQRKETLKTIDILTKERDRVRQTRANLLRMYLNK